MTDPAQEKRKKKHAAEYTDMPEPTSPFMLLFRAESLFSWAEYVKVNRDLDDDENLDAAKAAEDLDFLSVANDGKTLASRFRFDLDLPSEAEDDFLLTQGLLYPEWDYKRQSYRDHYAHVEMMVASSTAARAAALFMCFGTATTATIPEPTAATDAHQAQQQGEEIDIDACVRYFSEHAIHTQQRSAQPKRYGMAPSATRPLFAFYWLICRCQPMLPPTMSNASSM